MRRPVDPVNPWTSLPQIPQAATRIRTSPGPGCGTSTSVKVSSPGDVSSNAFMAEVSGDGRLDGSIIIKTADLTCRRRARPTPRVPRGLFYGVLRVKRRLPPRVRQIPRAFPTSTNPIMASMAAPRQPPGGSWNGTNRAKTFVDPLGKGGWRAKGQCPSTWRTPSETGFRSKKRGKSTFSHARGRGRVDTALAHPYILLFDPTATPVALNGHWRLSRPVLPTMFIRRDRIVSTGFPGLNAPWKRPGWSAEGVVESRLVGFGRFVWFFCPIGLAVVCRAGLRPAGRLSPAVGGLVEFGAFARCLRFDRPVSVE